MKVLEKQETEQAYREAMQELQEMYDELFYEDVKRRLTETTERLRAFQEEIVREVQDAKGQTNGVIGALREDLARKLKAEAAQLAQAIAETRTTASGDMAVMLNHLSELLQKEMGQRTEELSGKLQDLEAKVLRKQEQERAVMERGLAVLSQELKEKEARQQETIQAIQDMMREHREALAQQLQEGAAHGTKQMEVMRVSQEEKHRSMTKWLYMLCGGQAAILLVLVYLLVNG